MNIKQDGIAPNAGRLLWAGFMAILAAGVGFGIRGGILANWGAEFGFTGAELGDISGATFTSFCFGIIIGGLVCDRIGYGWLVIAAFALHALSAFITFAPTAAMPKETVYKLLYAGMFLFGYANGTLEAVANPLVATLFPSKRTHYLNILHASWPAGLVLGGVVGWVLGEHFTWHWKAQLALFLAPTVVYGLMFLGQHMPKSEATQKGLGLAERLKDVGILGGLIVCFLLALFFKGIMGLPDGAAYGLAGVLLIVVAVMTRFAIGAWLLFVLYITHALIGAVELGTDGWIQNITGNILTPGEGKILFVFTSAIMFSLRFCADFIERNLKLSPVGILLVCAILACLGLNLSSNIATFAGALLALAVYAVGKTFFWPTMLAVVGDRFPRTGAVAMSIIAGVGMMSAGLIGSPGLGYAKDRFASEALQKADPAVYEAYKVAEAKRWLFFKEVSAVDGKKLGEVQESLKKAREEVAATGARDPKAAMEQLAPAQKTVLESSIIGDRKTLRADSAIPATMAVIYLLLLIYFKAIGGYKVVHIVEGAGSAGSKSA